MEAQTKLDIFYDKTLIDHNNRQALSPKERITTIFNATYIREEIMEEIANRFRKNGKITTINRHIINGDISYFIEIRDN